MDLFILIMVVVLLVVLNGLFVAAEFAIIGVSRVAVEQRANEGSKIASVVLGILQDPVKQDRYIATAQLGITFASLGLGMYGEHSLAEWLAPHLIALGAAQWIAAHTLASILAIALLTYLHIVIGEMVPKSLALMYAERTALSITRPMIWIKRILYPLVVGLNGIGNGVLRLMGIRRQFDAGQYHSPEELRYIVTESQEGGVLRAESGRVLQELLDFRDLTADEVMVPRVQIIGLPSNAGIEEIRELVKGSPHIRYPVYEKSLDNIVGIVHLKDLLQLLTDDQPISHLMRPVGFLPGTADLDRVLDSMREFNTQMVVVMDEFGGTAGLITIDDLCDEVIGEIEEGRGSHPEIYKDASGLLHVSGTVRIAEIGERLELPTDLEHEEVDSVSGLILSLLERPPTVADTVEYEGIRFVVTVVEGNGVGECVVSLIDPPTIDEDES